MRWLVNIRRPGCRCASPIVAALVLGLALVPVARAQTDDASETPVDRVRALWQAGQRDAAHAMVDSVLPVARAATDTTTVCRLQILRGVMHTALGDGANGELPLREGLALARERRDAQWELIALRWLGVALGQNLKDVEAAQIFATLRERAQAEGNREQEAWAETGLGYQEGRVGRSEGAREHYAKAITIFREQGQVRGEIFALNGLGNILNQLSDFAAARDCYTETLAVSLRIGATYTEAMAENNLGTLEYSLGDPGRALSHFERSYTINLAADNLREAINAARNIAICQTDLGQYDQSLEMMDAALAVCRQRQYRELEYLALTQRGIVLSLQGRSSQAEAVFAELAAWPDAVPLRARTERIFGQALALGRFGELPAGCDLLLAHESDARQVEEPGLRLAYLAYLGKTLGQVGQPRAALSLLPAVVAEARQLQLSAPLLTALVATGAAYRALAEPDSAFAIYGEAAAVWERERSVPLDPEWRERRGVAGKAIYTQLADLTMVLASGEPHRERVRAAYELLQGFKARTLFERLVGPQRTTLAPPVPVSLSELQESLRPETEILVDYFNGNEYSFVFAVTRDQVRVCRLAAADELAEKVDLYRDLIAQPTSGAAVRAAMLAAGARALRSALLDSLAEVVSAHSRVIFCPDGALHHLPLGLLLGRDGAAPASIVDRVPSASILVRLRREAVPVSARRVLAVAGGGPAQEDSLGSARQEVAWLGRTFGGVDHGLPDTTAMVTALGDYDLIHLASHARVNGASPWRSTIQARTVGGDLRVLNAAEIAGGRLSAGLAVLASCESAGGAVVGGEGVTGLGSAFIAAGVPTVAASLWPVDDAATYVLMRAFYEELARGAPASSALAMAQAEVARSAELSDPAYWAGFVIIGDGDQVVSLSPGPGARRRRGLFWLGIILLCGAGLVAWGQTRHTFL